MEPKIFFRYVDDIFMTIRKEDIARTIVLINNWHANLKFTYEVQDSAGSLNFLDMTSFLDLERQKEKYRMIKLLNTTIHHEMIAPLKAQMDISKCLADT